MSTAQASLQPAEGVWTSKKPDVRASAGHRSSEGRWIARAAVSSLVATLVDGVCYQAVLLSLAGRYALAAVMGAGIGAITNFALNRSWAFSRTSKPLWTQLWQYGLAAAATYGVLQLMLVLTIEGLTVDERIAWVPAKAVAWLMVSYPLHRLLVFRK